MIFLAIVMIAWLAYAASTTGSVMGWPLFPGYIRLSLIACIELSFQVAAYRLRKTIAANGWNTAPVQAPT